jgi:dienelactone hydrolase
VKNNRTKNRRSFLKQSVAGIGAVASAPLVASAVNWTESSAIDAFAGPIQAGESLIGAYGSWAASLTDGKLPSLSFRRSEFTDPGSWRTSARRRLTERMGIPDLGGLPQITVKSKATYDGLSVEEIAWRLPSGQVSEATVLKPQHSRGRLPAILALHDHAGNKYFGKQKITRSTRQHPMMVEHQKEYYGGAAWANVIAKRGYVVMVPDAFAFESRRVRITDVPSTIRKGLSEPSDDNLDSINAYNRWAGEHEHIMARSLFSAGTTWPGVFFAEDQKALDILCAREDVDGSRVGCGGLSGGGLRTVFLAGLDDRIKCACAAGFMTTWRDLALSKSYTHTWMTYVPLLPNELDFPEIIAMRAPLPTLVLNNREDQLFTRTEMERADDLVKEIYAKAKAADRYKCSFYPGPHKFDTPMQADAFGWFDQWLK